MEVPRKLNPVLRTIGYTCCTYLLAFVAGDAIIAFFGMNPGEIGEKAGHIFSTLAFVSVIAQYVVVAVLDKQ